MRRALPLTSELRTDDNACGNVNVMSDNALRVNDDASEMCKIEALADISVIRDLEVIFTAQSVESVIAYAELELIELLPDSVILLDLVSIITRTSHYADIAEFRGRSALFEIACINILVASCITGVSEQIGIYNVFKFISHKCTNLHFCYLKNFITFCGRTQ